MFISFPVINTKIIPLSLHRIDREPLVRLLIPAAFPAQSLSFFAFFMLPENNISIKGEL